MVVIEEVTFNLYAYEGLQLAGINRGKEIELAKQQKRSLAGA
jgi:hypothetical protein